MMRQRSISPRQLLEKSWGVGLFVSCYIILAAILSFSTKNWEFVLYIGVILCIAALVVWIGLLVDFSRGIYWGMALWGIAHMAGGLVHIPLDWPIEGTKHVLYSWWLLPFLKYDHIIHFYGFAVMTVVCWQALKNALKVSVPRFGVLSLCVLGAMGFGALNEVIEFFATLLIPNTNVGGYVNTGWDLVANMLGAIVAAICILIVWKKHTRHEQRRRSGV